MYVCSGAMDDEVDQDSKEEEEEDGGGGEGGAGGGGGAGEGHALGEGDAARISGVVTGEEEESKRRVPATFAAAATVAAEESKRRRVQRGCWLTLREAVLFLSQLSALALDASGTCGASCNRALQQSCNSAATEGAMPDAERVLSAADSELQRSARELQQSCNRAATERVLSAADYGGVASTILRVIFSTEHTGLVEQAASALREVLNVLALLVQKYKY